MSAQTLSLFPVTALQIQSYCHFGQFGPSRLSDRVELETFRDLHQLHSRPFQLHLLIRFAKLHIFAVLPFSCIAFTSLSIPKTGLTLNSAMFLAVWMLFAIRNSDEIYLPNWTWTPGMDWNAVDCRQFMRETKARTRKIGRFCCFLRL